MPSFRFDVIEAKLTHGVGDDVYTGEWKFSVSCKLDKEVRGTDRENVGYFRAGGSFDVTGHNARYVAALAEKGMRLPKEPVIGLLHWFKGRDDPIDGSPQAVLFDLELPQAQLDEMFVMARAGRNPSMISVDTPFDKEFGVKYGWEPDGSSVEWDIETCPRVPIIGASIEYKLVSRPRNYDSLSEGTG